MSISIALKPTHHAPDSCRRYATRYEPTSRDACISWWEPRSEAGTDSTSPSTESVASSNWVALSQFALLLDISHTGASLTLDRAPRKGEDVWLRLEGECSTEWTEAEVVGVTTTTRGPHVIRLAFRAPCPFETLRAAVCS